MAGAIGRSYSKDSKFKTNSVDERIVFREINALVAHGRMLISEAEAQGKKPNIWMVRYTHYAASLMMKLMLTRKEAGLPMYREYARAPKSRISFR